MSITQTFYNHLAPQYHKLFLSWDNSVAEQAALLDKLFCANGFDRSARILDCACGIGTQAIGLGLLGYDVTASDISEGALAEAEKRAAEMGAELTFTKADFCALGESFTQTFDVIIAMDNALPHMLSRAALESAVGSIAGKLSPGGVFVGSIRDYDALLLDTPPYSAPYIHKTNEGQRVAFQTWDWEGENYTLTQYIVEDEETLQLSKFVCEYRATRREELTELLLAKGCCEVRWLFPEETAFYQPIVVAKKG